MTRLLGLLAAAATVLLLAVTGGACSESGEPLTLEEYFQRLDDLDDEFDTASSAVDDKIQASRSLDDIRGYMHDQVDVFDDFIGGLKDLDPPDEAKAPHDQSVAALSNFRDELSGAIDDAGDATTVDDLFAAFNDLDVTSLNDANAACRELEQIAADNGITVDLDCEEDIPEDGGDGTDGGGATATVEPVPDEGATDDGDGTDGRVSASLEDYFQQLDEAENTYRVVSDETDTALSALDDTTADQGADIFRNIKEAIDDFVAELEDIEPPAAVAAAHEETLAGFRAVSELIDGGLPAMEAAVTLDEVFAPFNTQEFMSLSTSLGETCNALQGIADTNGISVDLGCPEEG